MRKLQRSYNLITAAIFTLAISLFAMPVWAQQAQSGTILQESIEASKKSTEAMDEMWTELFVNSPENKTLLYDQVVRISTMILIFGFFFLMLSFAKAMKANDQDKVMEIVVWGLIIGVLLNNSGAHLKSSTMTARHIVNEQTRAVLAIQVGKLTIQQAEQDVILTDQAVERVKEAFVGCEAKESDEQWRCFEEGAAEAADFLKEYEDGRIIPPGVERLMRNIAALDKTIQDEKAKSAGGLLTSAAASTNPVNTIKNALDTDVARLLWQSATNSASRTLLKSFQNWFTFGFEFAMLLTGLLGPIAAAASLLPQQPRAIVSWIIAFFSLGMLKLSYNLLVGFAAVYATKTSIQDYGSSGFLMMMSIGAPLISIAVAGGGGAAIFFALGKTTATIATIIPMAGSAAAGAMPARKAAR